MKKSKFSPQQIFRILEGFDKGKTAAEMSREHGISTALFTNGMNGKELKRLKELEEEN